MRAERRSAAPRAPSRARRWLAPVVDDGVVDLAAIRRRASRSRIALDAALAVAARRAPGPEAARLDRPVERHPTCVGTTKPRRKLFAVLERGRRAGVALPRDDGRARTRAPGARGGGDRRRADPFLARSGAGLALHARRPDQGDRRRPTRPPAAEHAAARAPRVALARGADPGHRRRGPSPVQLARRLAQRLDLGAAAEQEIALLVGDSGLLPGRGPQARRARGGAGLPIAAHLELPERARALYLADARARRSHATGARAARRAASAGARPARSART